MRPDLEAIKARADAATSRVWKLWTREQEAWCEANGLCKWCGGQNPLVESRESPSRIIENKIHTHALTLEIAPRGSEIVEDDDYFEGWTLLPQDVRFLVHTREDVPALLEYIAELEAKLAKFKLCEEHYGPVMPCGGEACYHMEDPDDD